MISKPLHRCAPLIALAALVAGCGTTEVCVPCTGDDPATPAVEGTACPDFGGAYLGAFSGASSNCTDAPILQGQVNVQVTTQGTAGELTSDVVGLRLTDQEGNWTLFDGTAQVCAESTALAQDPAAAGRTFRFSVQYTEVDGALRVVSRLFGAPVVAVDAGQVTSRSFTATYSATKTDTEEPGQNCQITARLTASEE